jgi:ABC-type phosphate/phosphonate transport system substrate-binding protein
MSATDAPAPSARPLLANARMYSISPAVADAWRQLLGWVLREAQLPWSVIDYPPPKPLLDLWARPDLGCALMCGLPHMLYFEHATAIVAPVVRGARYREQPIYFTDIVVRSSSPYETLEDCFGGRVGYTLKESQSGYVALREHLLPYRQRLGSRLFAEVVGPLVNPRGIIDALLQDRIDLGPLDSYAHDLIRHVEPEIAGRLRTIATTRPAPIPQFVATAPLDDHLVARLRSGFMRVIAADELKSIRDMLLLSNFAVPRIEDYQTFHARAAASDQYPDPW